MTYEYRCKGCGQTFEVTATVAKKERGLHPKCPRCGSKATAQVFTSFGVLSGSARSAADGAAGSGGGCFPGSGCCG